MNNLKIYSCQIANSTLPIFPLISLFVESFIDPQHYMYSIYKYFFVRSKIKINIVEDYVASIKIYLMYECILIDTVMI